MNSVPRTHTSNSRIRRRRTLQRNVVVASMVLSVAYLANCWVPSTAFLQPSTVTRAGLERLHLVASDFHQATVDRYSAELSCSLEDERCADPDEDFELCVGRALDTLRADYPRLLTDEPKYEIYAQDIEIVDPSGVKVRGIGSYKYTFRIVHALVKFLYSPERSGLTFRMCFDKARQNIRIHWNAEIVPRRLFGAQSQHVDGISVYEFNKESGEIIQHRIERLLLNDRPVQPKGGVIAALQREHRVSVPSFARDEPMEGTYGFFASTEGEKRFALSESADEFNQNFVLNFQPSFYGRSKATTSLFAFEAVGNKDDNLEDYPGLDRQKFEAKNNSRKKFGLEPLSPEEFLAVEAQVKEMDLQQKQKAAEAAAAAAAKPKKKPGLFDKILGSPLLKDTCESNFDCQRPEVCCDFGFKKMCCSSGAFVGNSQMSPQIQPVPVPVPADLPPGMNRN